MTKAPLLCLLALALLANPVLAHGNPEPRDIDTRVAIDVNSLTVLDYCAANGLAEDGGQSLPPEAIPLCEGGHDLMDLDLREGWGPDGNGTAPGLHVRLIFRRGFVELNGPITDRITFKLDGAAKSLELKTEDNEAFTSTDFTWVSAKSPAATYESQVFAFIPYTRLGAGPGSQLTEISVLSVAGSKDTDVIPGTYYYQGQYVPDDGEASVGFGVPPTVGTADNGPLAYKLAGPATLVSLDGAHDVHLEENQTHAVVHLTAKAAGTKLDQVATLRVEAPAGIRAALSQSTVKLGNSTPEAGVELVLDVAEGATSGDVRVVLETDLGGRAELVLPVEVPAAEHADLHEAEPADEHDGHGHVHGEESKASPAASVGVLLVLLAFAALRRRV